MTIVPKQTTATVIPSLRYDDAPAAIDWLCRAFGFTKQAVYPFEDGRIAHAQLTFGNGMLMLSSTGGEETDWSRFMRQPEQVGGASTSTICIIVSDADVVYATAKAAGARIIRDIRDEDYGGRAFVCLDCEGHLWSFGTYDPWAG